MSRERILATAGKLLEEEGLERLSMRRLAEELGAGTMTLYGYFRSKDELLDALVDAVSEQLSDPPDAGSWEEQLKALMHELLALLRRYPVAIEIRRRRPMVSPGALRLTERGMRILLGAGFEREQSARAYRSLFLLTYGFAAFGPSEASEDDLRRSRAALAALPEDEYPAVTHGGAALVDTMRGEELFEWALDHLLAGIAAAKP